MHAHMTCHLPTDVPSTPRSICKCPSGYYMLLFIQCMSCLVGLTCLWMITDVCCGNQDHRHSEACQTVCVHLPKVTCCHICTESFECRVDAWHHLKPRDPGLTYDGKSNPMLGPYNRLRLRLDRVFCKTCKYKLQSIKMVGTCPLPGVTYTKSYKKGPTALPVLPSDHFGLLATLKYAT